MARPFFGVIRDAVDIACGGIAEWCRDCRKAGKSQRGPNHSIDQACANRAIDGKCNCVGPCIDPRRGARDECPFPFPELDEFQREVFDLFLACDTQWTWDSGMGFTRRVGIPNDRVLREARIRGYRPEEDFLSAFHACERALIDYDLQRQSTSE